MKNRLEKYREGGIEALTHGNKGRKPARTFSEEIRKEVVDLYVSSYRDASFTHFREILLEDKNLDISDQTIGRWLKADLITSPKSHKRTVRKIMKELESRYENLGSPESKARMERLAVEISADDAHPRRAKSKYFGEMIQMDASSYRWNGHCVWHLHIAVDDATGELVGAWFDRQETLNGYYHVLEQILRKYGIPAMLYTDRRTVFEYERKDKRHEHEEKDTFTQFSAACASLGIELKTTSVPTAKGKVERFNGSLQSRLPVDLRRNGIYTMDAANAFLVQHYIENYNRRFSCLDDSFRSNSVFIDCVDDAMINRTLAVIFERCIDSGHCIKFQREYYLPVDKNGNNRFFRKGTKALVIVAYDKSLFLNINDELFSLVKVPDHCHTSRNFDEDTAPKPKFKPYIPPLDHPWRKFTYTSTRRRLKDEE